MLLGLRYCRRAAGDNRGLLRVAMGWTCSSRVQKYGCYLKKTGPFYTDTKQSDNIKIVFDKAIVNIWLTVTWDRYVSCH